MKMCQGFPGASLPTKSRARVSSIQRDGYTWQKLCSDFPNIFLKLKMGFDEDKAFALLKVATTGLVGMFVGGAAYINIVEHPARMQLADTKWCHKQWKESFDRARVYQSRLALASVATGVGAYYLKRSSTGTPWLIAAGTMATVFPYTLFILKPNSIDPIYDDEITSKKSEGFIRDTVVAWNGYHMFRTAVSFSTFIWCLGHLTSDKLW